MNEFDYKGFWSDFTVAERFGNGAIEDTFNRVMKEWGDNVEYFASFVMTLNHKLWQWYEKNEDLAKIFDDLWMKADEYAVNHFKGDDLSYYYRFLDKRNTIW